MIVLLSCMGCAHAVSEKLRSQVDPQLTFSQLMQSPETYIGEIVILGGTVVMTRNYEEGSEIEVIQNDLDYSDYPVNDDQSRGRFLFFYNGYLESEIYAEGRKVTGAGKVKGVTEGKVGGQTYLFLVVEVEELKLWEEYISSGPYYNYPYYGGYPYGGHPFFYNRYYGYPYGYPYWRPHLHRRHH